MYRQNRSLTCQEHHIIAHCNTCNSLNHGFGAKGDEFGLGGVHLKFVLPHPIIYAAEGVRS